MSFHWDRSRVTHIRLRISIVESLGKHYPFSSSKIGCFRLAYLVLL